MLVAALIRPGELVRAPVGAVTAVTWTLLVVIFVGLPLGALPWDQPTTDENGQANGYSWPDWSPWEIQGSPKSYVNSWANWNYTGYEGKDSYAEYRDIVQTMGALGDDPDYGCGRAHWEYDASLDRYGTPMAMMLLPYWTDGCIGSMEGLYFESAATTPFHFLTVSELASEPSNPQRGLPYGSIQNDFDRGVEHLRMLGVRFFLAGSDTGNNLSSGSWPRLPTGVAFTGTLLQWGAAHSPKGGGVVMTHDGCGAEVRTVVRCAAGHDVDETDVVIAPAGSLHAEAKGTL